MPRTLELVVPPKGSEIAPGFSVNRALPRRERRTVGPFVFLDHMGPKQLGPGEELYVPPHGHFGLETVTYLFGGRLLHRDSTDVEQLIEPGAVNWMTAGRGIVHSELATHEPGQDNTLHGVQIWVGLPGETRFAEPGFQHVDAASLPRISSEAGSIRVVAGEHEGARAPVQVHSELLLLDLAMEAGQPMQVELQHPEAGLYLAEGSLTELGGRRLEGLPVGSMLHLAGLGPLQLKAESAARLILVAGEPLPEKKYLYDNYVGNSLAEARQAHEDFREGRFGSVSARR